MIRVFLIIRFFFDFRGFVSFWLHQRNLAGVVHSHEIMKGVIEPRMVLTKKFPKLFKSFIRVSALENLPRCTADAGVGTTESLRHHIQHHTFADVCENNSHKIYTTVFTT
jgi:hypothetical protein